MECQVEFLHITTQLKLRSPSHLRVLKNPAADGAALVLVFAAVGAYARGGEAGQDELADAPARREFQRQAVGVVEFQRQGALEARVDPAGVLDEEAHPAHGASR